MEISIQTTNRTKITNRKVMKDMDKKETFRRCLWILHNYRELLDQELQEILDISLRDRHGKHHFPSREEWEEGAREWIVNNVMLNE